MKQQSLTNAEFAILGLLSEEDSHGYELERKIDQRGMREWTEIGFSSIYFVLSKLEKRKLIRAIKAKTPKSRKTFSLTPLGYQIHAQKTYEAIAEPHRIYPSILLGLANWPAIEPEHALEALKTRKENLDDALRTTTARYNQQLPMPDFVEIQFNYSLNQLKAELSWVQTSIAKMEGNALSKIDFKKTLKSLYQPSAKTFSVVDVPRMKFIMIDGEGAPYSESYNAALSWLYPLSYGLKFMSKQDLKRDYVVPPLEGLWWADDMSAYLEGRKEEWFWTMMIMQPDWITDEMYLDVLTAKKAKLGAPSKSLRLAPYEEGLSVQIMHIGPYSAEGPILNKMHNQYIPENELIMTGHHHEIYISDPRRTAPQKLKTVLRQPVKRSCRPANLL